jgi:hypothetical protein
MTANSLIDATIREIAEAYQPRTLAWMKANSPDDWGNMLTLEGRVNEMAFGSDTDSLKRALSDYQGLILAMVKEFKALKEKKGQEIFNFVEHPKSPRDGLEVGRGNKV